MAPYKRIGNELEKLLDERKSLDAKITKLKEILERLRSLSKEERRKASLIDSNQEPISSLALTEAIRQILQRSGLAMLPRQVRDRLLMFECELPKQNPLAAIHGTLKRLQAKGEIEGIPQEDGKMTYRWITSVERALDSLSRN